MSCVFIGLFCLVLEVFRGRFARAVAVTAAVALPLAVAVTVAVAILVARAVAVTAAAALPLAVAVVVAHLHVALERRLALAEKGALNFAAEL